MKKYLIVLLLVLPVFCKAQQDTSFFKRQDGSTDTIIYLHLTLDTLPRTTYLWENNLPTSLNDRLTILKQNGRAETDTIKVIMLVCDTSTSYHWRGGNLIDQYGKKHPDSGHEDKDQKIYWQYGYSVFSINRKWVDRDYLDQNKQKLPDNIIVWDAKEIK